MKIIKCDRCGSTYTQNKDKWNVPLIYRITWNNQPKDLCDDCFAKLQIWMTNPDEEWR
jgi:hypothetical protein